MCTEMASCGHVVLVYIHVSLQSYVKAKLTVRSTMRDEMVNAGRPGGASSVDRASSLIIIMSQ